MMGDLKDKVVVITGASAGIGAGTALKFAEQRSKLALCGRNKESLEAVARRCVDKGMDKNNILTVTGDLLNEEDIQHMVSEITEYFHQIDVLVNNAGFGFPGSIEDVSLATFDDIYKISIRAVVSLVQKFLPYLKQSRGSIINISSEAAIRPYPEIVAYCTMKAGLDHLTRCLAAEVGPHGIRVNGVNPGTIKTDIFIRNGFCKNNEEAEKLFEEAGQHYPLRRAGDVEDVADVIVFMASSKASFVTGSNFVVDGGCSQLVGAF